MRVFCFVLAMFFAALALAPQARADWTRDQQPPRGIEGRLRDGGAAGEGVSGRYELQDSQFTAQVHLEKNGEGTMAATGTLTLLDTTDVVRWSSWRLFLVFYDGASEVGRVHLPSSENSRHELVFKKSFALDRPFDRLELVIVGSIRYLN